jgi:hypothetical protein
LDSAPVSLGLFGRIEAKEALTPYQFSHHILIVIVGSNQFWSDGGTLLSRWSTVYPFVTAVRLTIFFYAILILEAIYPVVGVKLIHPILDAPEVGDEDDVVSPKPVIGACCTECTPHITTP